MLKNICDFLLIYFRTIARLRSELNRVIYVKKSGPGCRIYSGFTVHKAAQITLQSNVTLQPYSYLQVMSEGCVEIGDKSTLGRFSMITCANKITIGRKVMIGAYVQITDHSHGVDIKSPMYDQQSLLGEVTIEDDVWIGSGAIILMNVSIGKGAIIGAGAVVNRDIAPYSIVAGVPARLVRYRCDTLEANSPR